MFHGTSKSLVMCGHLSKAHHISPCFYNAIDSQKSKKIHLSLTKPELHIYYMYIGTQLEFGLK